MSTPGPAAALDIAALYDRLAPGYDQTVLGLFPFVADHLLGRLHLRPGAKLLDVGAGTGAVALAAGPMVAPGGRVTAVDVSEAVLARLQAKAARMGLGNVDVHTMDAGQLEFRRDYFEAVTASFVLCQLPDPGGAVAQWLRVLKPGGELAVATLGAGAFAPLLDELRATLGALGVALPEPPFAAPERCGDLLRDAGAGTVEVTVRDFGYHLAHGEEWWSVIWASGLIPVLHTLDPPDLGELRRRHMSRVAEYAGGRGIRLSLPVNIVRGRAQ